MRVYGISVEVSLRADSPEAALKAAERLIVEIKAINPESGINVLDIAIADGPEELAD